MTRTNKAIEDLCISYHAYMNAISTHNDKAIVVWAQCLIRDQKDTGVEMVPNERLASTITLRENILKEIY